MSDADALLNAIVAHPDEDTPRVMYADWLDEHGQSIRAEFIRVQCAVKQLESRPAEEQRQEVQLWRRQQEFLDNHRIDLLGPLGSELTYFDAIFDRGFVAELTIPAPVFLRHAHSLPAFRPTPRILVTLDAETFDAMLQCPELGLIESLDAPHEVGETGAQRLASCPHLGRLKVLNLESNEIGDGGLIALAQSKNLTALTELNVSGNQITDDGLSVLLGSPRWLRLRRLNLSLNPLSLAAAEQLADAPRNEIEHIDLRFTEIGPEGYTLLLRRYGGRVDLF
jgi:uncharacterized protein (TIGR02996 family)